MSATILIVEDEEAVAATLSPILEKEGYRCESAATVSAAMAKIEDTPFDVLLVDIQVGEANGLSVLTRLKNVAPEAVGIVFTGYGSMEAALQAMHAGADDFLVKPVEVAELKASIARGLHWRTRLAERSAELARMISQLQAATEAREELEDLIRLKEEFIAVASHDLKSPLTSIRGYAQVLARLMRRPTPDLAQVVHGLGVIDGQAAAMARLLDDLLDASRIQAGVLDLRTGPCAFRDCVNTVLARFSPQERERIIVHLPRRPLVGEWERPRIEQVVANLLGNALKYSPEALIVDVRAKRSGVAMEVAVSDRGIGIPREELSRIFERFHRTPQGHASGLPGTGLGLYICQGIVQEHGGRIWAESAGVGEGATFRFTLPLEPAKPRPDADPEGSAE